MAISVSKLSKKRLGDYVINAYVGCEHGCKHCYCPAMPGVRLHNNGHDQEEWGTYVYPKDGFIESLRRDIRRFPRPGSKAGQGKILISFLTDPYAPIEATHHLTRQALQITLGAGCNVRIQTRSALVEQDFELLTDHKDQVLLGTSLPYLDDRLARVLEPGATTPMRRLEMLQRAKSAGLRIYVAIAPVMPFHGEDELNRIVEAIAPLDPVEIFDEVLNPRSKNLGMMTAALEAAGRSERIADDYIEKWPRFTYDHLMTAKRVCEGAGVGQRFIAWPDPHATRSKSLNTEEQSWLRDWLPSEAEMVIPKTPKPTEMDALISFVEQYANEIG